MEQTPKKHVSHVIAWSLIALFAGSLAFGIWMYSNQIDTIYAGSVNLSVTHKKTAATTGTTTATTGATTGTTTTDNTADWKTYTDTTYGYSVKYPSNWVVNNSNLKLIEFREKGKTYSIEATDIYAIAISIDEKAQTKTALELANERKSIITVGTATVTETTIDSFKAAQIEDYLQKTTIIVNDNKRYNIVTPNFGSDTDNTSIRSVYDNMLSTFTFAK